MAKLASLIKFKGSIDGVTIDKNGVVKNAEFAIAAKQSKVIRNALRVLAID